MKQTKLPMLTEKKEHGFSLIELMISIAIVGIIMVTLATVFERSSRLYTTQNVSASLQEEVRAALEIMAGEMIMAGYDPKQTNDFKLEKDDMSATHLRFTLDRNSDGTLDINGFPECENVAFRFSLSQQALSIICDENTGSADVQWLIGGDYTDTKVTSFGIVYRNDQNQPVNPATVVDTGLIRNAIVTLTAQAPAGKAGMVERTYTSQVSFRNIGINYINN